MSKILCQLPAPGSFLLFVTRSFCRKNEIESSAVFIAPLCSHKWTPVFAQKLPSHHRPQALGFEQASFLLHCQWARAGLGEVRTRQLAVKQFVSRTGLRPFLKTSLHSVLHPSCQVQSLVTKSQRQTAEAIYTSLHEIALSQRRRQVSHPLSVRISERGRGLASCVRVCLFRTEELLPSEQKLKQPQYS